MSKAPKFGVAGFTVQRSTPSSARAAALPPPPNSAFSKQGYSTLNSINHNAITAAWGIPKKRTKTEEEYFEEEDDADNSCLEYIPAPGSPSGKQSLVNESDEDEDPLDAFMAGIEKQVKKEESKCCTSTFVEDEKNQNIRDDIEGEDVEESYYRYMEENPRAGLQDDESDNEIEYDEDGNPIAPKKNKIIDPLPSIDHSTVEYRAFEKNFYTVHEEIVRLSKEQVKVLRETLGVKVTGPDPPNPVSSFAHFGFDESLMKVIRKSEYSQPTPIQAQAVPAALSGRDVLGIAKTGSGKTAAFIWPMLVHIIDQKELEPGDGPIGLILAPTRELSQQIYMEAKRFGKTYNIRVVCCYGGGSKWEQSKSLESGAEVVVATPGRIIDLVKMKATNLSRVTFLVLDEADRMFDMGFEPQVRSICNHTRPDRQTLLFSATFKKRVEKLARDALSDPIRIVQGDIGEANADVTQIVCVTSQTAKLSWLQQNFVYFLSIGSVLIFVTRKLQAEELAHTLAIKEYDVLLLHGDMDQTERNRVITKFKKQEVNILIATDVAARGLDIPHIKTVVNYDVARDIDTHTHRIGRTGRAGEKGTAYTLITEKDKDFAGHLVRNLESVNQDVPSALMDLAMQNAWFRKSRFKSGKGKSLNIGGAGLGYRERSERFTQHEGSILPGIEGVLPAAQKSGPGSERLAALKAAFKTQYQSQFTASEDHTWEQTRNKIQYGVQLVKPADFPADTTSSNADASNKELTNVHTATDRRKKKSRWDSS